MTTHNARFGIRATDNHKRYMLAEDATLEHAQTLVSLLPAGAWEACTVREVECVAWYGDALGEGPAVRLDWRAVPPHGLGRGARVAYVGADTEWQGALGRVARVYTYEDGTAAADVYWDVGGSHLVDVGALERVEV